MSDTPTQKWLSTIPSQNRISWKAGNRIPGKYGSSRQTNASRSNTATGLSPLLVGHTRHPAVFLKAQLVLFLAKASPYGSCGIQNETRILENTQFALIDFFRDSQHHPLRSRVCNLQEPPSSPNDPWEGGTARGLGAQPLSQIANLGVCPLFGPPYVPLVIPCRPGVLFGLIPLLSGLQEVHKKAISQKRPIMT